MQFCDIQKTSWKGLIFCQIGSQYCLDRSQYHPEQHLHDLHVALSCDATGDAPCFNASSFSRALWIASLLCLVLRVGGFFLVEHIYHNKFILQSSLNGQSLMKEFSSPSLWVLSPTVALMECAVFERKRSRIFERKRSRIAPASNSCVNWISLSVWDWISAWDWISLWDYISVRDWIGA